MKRFFLLLMLIPIALGLASCDYHDRFITVGDLPTKTTTFIADVFPNCDIVSIDKDRDIDGVTYDVVLSCGVRLEFNRSGEWNEIDCEPNAVPEVVIPEGIKNFMAENYSKYFIEKISREWYGYKVELNIDVELTFDKNGNFRRFDD
jgi:hypothetical protein